MIPGPVKKLQPFRFILFSVLFLKKKKKKKKMTTTLKHKKKKKKKKKSFHNEMTAFLLSTIM